MTRPEFAPGTVVQLRSAPHRIGRVADRPPRGAPDNPFYLIVFDAGRSSLHPLSDLQVCAFETETIEDRLRAGQFESRPAFSKLITFLKLKSSLDRHIYSMAASRTTFYPYQFKPVLKFLESEKHRLLIADEVGLGKTIEACLVLAEMQCRRDLRRVLVIVPSHLQTKWRDEMRRRFALEFEIMKSPALLEFLRKYEEEGEEVRLRGIVSLQAIRGRALQERWEEVSPSLDLAIFDEAGRLRNTGTLSNTSAVRIADTADGVLLLTATPVQTHDTDLFNLLRLLDPDEFSSFELFSERLRANLPILEATRLVAAGARADTCLAALRCVEESTLAQRFLSNPIYHDIVRRLSEGKIADRRRAIELQRDLTSLNVLGHVLSRTRKREVHERQPVRRSRVYEVMPTDAEREFYSRVTELCRHAASTAAGEPMRAFVAMMPQRQMASCMVAMVDRCLSSLRGTQGPSSIEDSDLEFGGDADTAPPAVRSMVDWSRLGDLRAWREQLEAKDTKFEALFQALSDTFEDDDDAKVVLFSYFKGTLRYLEKKLSERGIPCIRVDGDVPSVPEDPQRDERGQRLERFRNDPKARLLLSSEVGDEGLDLQYARILINYDLPWNPMRVEQRIGRLDRIGQVAPVVKVISLSMSGTIEHRILEKLYDRIKLFERSIGDLESILGDRINDLERDLFSRHLSPAEEERRIEQTAEVIERRQQEASRFEAESSGLIGNDEFFLEQIESAREYRRFVGGDELVVFVNDFLRDHLRPSAIEPIDSGDGYRLVVSDALRSRVRQGVPPSDYGLRIFLQRSLSGTVRLTIDPEAAQRDHQLELLTSQHPLVRMVTRHYSEHPEELHPISYLRVGCGEVPEGRYVWFLHETKISGIRSSNELDLVALELETARVLSVDESDALLAAMSSRADAVPAGRRKAQIPAEICHVAGDVLVERVMRRVEEHGRVNEGLVAVRLASLRESHAREVRIRQQQIATARERGRSESYIRGRETGLRNMELTYQEKMKEVESCRGVTYAMEPRGAGVVEVFRGE